MRKLTLCNLSVPVLMALLVTTATGQTTFGSITGTVRDQSGAVVPGVSITVINQDTGVSRRAPTGADGVYSVTNLLPGTYRLQAEQKGFNLLEQSGIILDANRVVNVDVQLAVGSPSNKVEVTAQVPLINTETATTSYVKTADHLEDMPLLMRQSNSNMGFAVYNPGVGVNTSANIYANGVRQIDTYISNDGIVEMSDPTGVGGGPIAPDLDSVAQISFILANSPAEFKSPVNFTTVTKSGTNQYHGTVYYDWTGRAVNARDFFATSTPFRVYNDGAVSFGGPIRHNKTFFFGDYENSINHAQGVVNDNAPLAAWHTGDFSGLLPGTVVKDPLTGQPFPNNQIPASRINPVSQKAQDFFYPLPNFGPPTLRVGNYRGFHPTHNNQKTVDGRIDHTFSERDTVFGRLSYRHLPGLNALNFMPPLGSANQLRTAGTAVLSWTHAFGPTLLNEARAGYARNRNYHAPSLVGSDIISQLGIQGIGTQGLHDIPIFNITGVTGTNQTAYGLNLDTDFQYTDNLSWTHGAHSLKFGFDAIRDQIGGQNIPNNVYGAYTFTGTYTGAPYADFLLGIPQSTAQSIPAPEQYQRGTMWSIYAQDQWKVGPRLTLSYGVRYELQGPYYDKFGRIFNFDPKNAALVVPDKGLSSVNPLFPKNIPIETASQAGYPADTLMRFPKHNIYPRFGVAYKLTADGKTAIRAGYGIYGNTIYGAMAQTMASSSGPFGGSQTFTNTIANGVPRLVFPNPFVTGGGTVAAVQNVSGFNPNIKTPYTQQWNITLEKQIGTMGISIAYIGTRSIDLLYPRNLSQPAPGLAPYPGPLFKGLAAVTWAENGANQDYNSLQLSAVKNVGKNLTFTTGFTWARDLTNQLDNDWITGQSIQNQYDLRSEKGNNTYTPTRRYFADVVYSLPFHAQQRVVNTVIGGWRLSSIVTLQSGQWFTPSFDSFDPSNTNHQGGRPDRVAGVSVTPPGGSTVSDWFNLAAFKVPGCPDTTPVCTSPANIGRFGNTANNILQGPPTRNIDLALMKVFHPTERIAVQFQATAVNAFNHPNFNLPNGDISAPATANVITATLANYLQGSGTSRQIHFILRVRF